MKVQTVFMCDICEGRIEFDFEANCYLKHSH